MKVLAISDTHGMHDFFTKEDFIDIDMVIHAGDASNVKSPALNVYEMENFLRWFNELPVKYKIYVAGNHDTSVEAGLINPRHYESITYLEHESIEIEGIKIFGSPYSKAFGSWAFNVAVNKLDSYWQDIPSGTDIVITHGPPKGILDMADNFSTREPEYCGDKALRNHIERVNPKFNIFGHIHDNGDNINKGTRQVYGFRTVHINASCVTDRKFNYGLTSRGIRFEI
jgi:Icc-related predicted phosphoesterase